ncbi:MAG: CDP-diacylglycerol--glycerol-3-phosphate 3-phosphatidyltransferase [Ignavibacteriaceae bacterium]
MTLPNQLTVLRIVLTPVFFFLFLSGKTLHIQISLLVFLIAALTDWYDGWLARKFNYITAWGKFWDPLADKILTSVAFIAFVLVGLIPLWMVLIIVTRDLLITTLRALADYKNIPISTSYYAKWKTFLQMSFLYYLLILYTAVKTPEIYLISPESFDMLLNKEFIYIIMLLITIITFHSGLMYIIQNRKLIGIIFRNET